jgi:hypothetical protein
MHFIVGEEVPPDGSLPDEGLLDLGDLGPDDDADVDGGVDLGLDAGADAGVDLGPDADVDAGIDLGVDLGFDMSIGVDAEPPLGPPPDPSTCRTTPSILPFADPVLEKRWPSAFIHQESAVHVCSTPVVIDLDPDGVRNDPEVIFVSYPPIGRSEPPGVLRIWNPKTNVTRSYPEDPLAEGVLEATGNLAAGDVDGDGTIEIVGIGPAYGTYAFRADATLLWESPYPSASDRGPRLNPSIGGGPAIADLDGDGLAEVIVGRTVLDGATGALRWRGDETHGRGHNNTFLGPLSCAADLDGDGRMEVIAGRTAFRADGSVYWDSDVPDGFCAVADVLPDPGPEVVLVSSGYLRILDGQSGRQLYLVILRGRVRESVGGAPTIADFDGDGRPEFGVAHGSEYAVYDLDCRDGTPGCIGQDLRWAVPTNDDSSAGTGSSVFDFNGDGAAEVVYNDQQYFHVYDGRTGRVLFRHPNSSRTRTENPVIADVDDDGDAEIVFSANAEAFFVRPWFTEPGVFIWGDRRGGWVGARRIWNQHAYHITNVEESGAIPRREVDSWTVLNAYRQNLREDGDVLVTPDLWGGRGRYECNVDGTITLRVTVANYGLERVGEGVVVSFWRGLPGAGGARLGEARTTRGIDPGGAPEVVSFTAPWMAPVVDYYAVLDDPEGLPGGNVTECRENNNRVLFWRPECR